MPIIKYKSWKLEDALELIRTIQPKLHELRFHVTLGGGVLNNGESFKDLDLYILPFDNEDEQFGRMIVYLNDVFKHSRSLLEGHYSSASFRLKDIYEYDDKRVDIFVI